MKLIIITAAAVGALALAACTPAEEKAETPPATEVDVTTVAPPADPAAPPAATTPPATTPADGTTPPGTTPPTLPPETTPTSPATTPPAQ